MTEPVTSGLSGAAVFAGLLGITAISGEQAGVVLGAFVGAMVFATLRVEMTLREKAWQGILSWVLGIIGAKTAADTLSHISGGVLSPNNVVGAVVAATVSLVLLRGLMKLAEGSPLSFASKREDK